MSSVVDFSPDERAVLCQEHAEEALRRAGVLLEDLRPRSLESFADDQTRGLRAAAHEQRFEATPCVLAFPPHAVKVGSFHNAYCLRACVNTGGSINGASFARSSLAWRSTQL
jgi:hypothetical protein